jgi:YjbE family integral membrane protein
LDITEIDKFADLLPFLEMVLADFALIDVLSGAFWVAVGKIMFANVVLSGDNAVVIAMACRNLPDRQRTRAVLFGSLGAIVLRILFCAIVGVMLGVPYLKLVGGLLLLWIGVKLVTQEDESSDVKAHASLWAAIMTIVIADAVMSLDNAIAIAAAARGNFPLIMIGLVVSIPIIVLGATLISRLLDRHPWVALVGAGLIGWIGGEVIAGDGRFEKVLKSGEVLHLVRPDSVAAFFDSILPHAERSLAAFGAGLVVILGLYLTRRGQRFGDRA